MGLAVIQVQDIEISRRNSACPREPTSLTPWRNSESLVGEALKCKLHDLKIESWESSFTGVNSVNSELGKHSENSDWGLPEAYLCPGGLAPKCQPPERRSIRRTAGPGPHPHSSVLPAEATPPLLSPGRRDRKGQWG